MYMYIVTFEEYVPINNDCGYYMKSFREFSTIEKAKEFMADIYDYDLSDIREIRLLDAKELKVDIDELLD